jgi:RHS repeat-associated protein
MSVLRRYYRGHRLAVMRDAVANTSRYYHFDHQGTTQCLTDSTGAVTDRFAANAWGVQVKRTGTSTNTYRYAGEWGYCEGIDGTILYIRARWLVPKRSRWLSPDPLSGSTEQYRYASNNPIGHIDADGRQVQMSWDVNLPGKCGAHQYQIAISATARETGLSFRRLNERVAR